MISFCYRVFAVFFLLQPVDLIAQNRRPVPDHSSWVLDQKLWETTMTDLAKKNPMMRFKFLSANQRGLRSPIRGRLFGVPTGEVLVKGAEKGGKIEGVTISIFNRGDDRAISIADINQRFATIGRVLSEKTKSEPRDRSQSKAVNLKSLMWTSGKSAYLLEMSSSRSTAEFLRLRVAPVGKASKETKTVNRRRLSQNVVRETNGDVWIKNIPMVDQGRKGYCACATAARIYQYYGLETTQHEIAQIAQAGPQTGTLPSLMVSALKKVTTKMDSRVLTLYEYPKGIAETNVRSSKYLSGIKEVNSDVNKYQALAKKMGVGALTINGERGGKVSRNTAISIFAARQMMKGDIFREVMVKKSNYSRFQSQIRKYIREGVPIAWSLQLGMFPEKGLPQARGGHMRLIIGYNERTKEVIYSDSWGAGHERKKMPMANAYCMSNLLLALPPLH